MNYKTAFWIMIIIYGLDCILLTPYLLMTRLGRETGPLLSWGYYNTFFGFSFFYIWFVVFVILLWFGLKYLFKYLDYKLKNLAVYPKLTLVLAWTIGMIWTIIHNLKFIFN